MILSKKKSKDLNSDFQKYNAIKAHEEMVIKSGGGISNLLELIESKNCNIELLEQNIARLNGEINNMEKKFLQISVCYKFKNSFIAIEINKSFFKQKMKQKFKKLFYILNVIYLIKIKNIVILLNLYFLLQHLKIL